jgi:hypothetical protein
MDAGYKIQSTVWQTLKADPELSSLVKGVYVQDGKPLKAGYPVILLHIRSAAKSVSIPMLQTVFVEIVARSKSPDGEGTELEKMCTRVDTLLDEQYFSNGGYGGKLRRAGDLPPVYVPMLS